MASRNFCTTAELAAELGDADLGVIDASWHLPNTGRIGAAEFRRGHIPGAAFFDIDTIADLDQGLPHMLPKPETLAKEMGALGLGDGMRFVVYDALGLFAAARVWWTLRAYGVEEVRILEGGLPKWIKEGRPLESGEARARPPRSFTPRLDPSFVASLDDVREALASGSAQVVDARPADRFLGKAPEPRPGLKCGHMPGSINLPFVEIVDARPFEAARGAQGGVRRAQGRSWASRSSPPADRGSPRRSWRSRWKRPAARWKASTTARGRNGARATTRRSRPERPERWPATASARRRKGRAVSDRPHGLGSAPSEILPNASIELPRASKGLQKSFNFPQKISFSFPESRIINGLRANAAKKIAGRARGADREPRAAEANGPDARACASRFANP